MGADEGARRRVALLLLPAIYAFNCVDRLTIGLVLQDIKLDLGLSDTQLGLLTGIAFAAFYATMGVPIAKWADRGDRVKIIALSAGLSALAVALCSTAQTFAQLVLIRIAVAVGEAGCVPAANSLIADYFPRDQRPRAMAIFMLGQPLSVLTGYLLAGQLNEMWGWRVTFVAISLPGLLLAGMALLMLHEPRREHQTRTLNESRPAGKVPSMLEVWRTLWGNVTFRHVLIAFAIVYFFTQGIGKWQPTFFVRTYGMATGELGLWLTLIYGVCGIAGTWYGGRWAASHAAGNEGLQLRTIAVLYCGFGAITATAYLVQNEYVAFALFGMAALAVYATLGPLLASIQGLAPPRMRAVATALVYLFANLLGMGLGPLATGALSDALQPALGVESLRYAIVALTPGYLWCAWHLWRASATIERDYERATDPARS